MATSPLFNFETPEQVRAKIGKSGREQDLSLAGLSGTQLANLGGAAAGRLAAEGLFAALGKEDPQVARAKNIQSAITKAQEDSGGDIKKMYQSISSSLADLGETGAALQALQAFQQISQDELETDIARERLGIAKEGVDVNKTAEKGRNARAKESLVFKREKLVADKKIAKLRLAAANAKEEGVQQRALGRLKATVAKQFDKFVSSVDFADTSLKEYIKSDPDLGKFWGGLSSAAQEGLARTMQGKMLQKSGANTLSSTADGVLDFDKALQEAFKEAKAQYTPGGELQIPSNLTDQDLLNKYLNP